MTNLHDPLFYGMVGVFAAQVDDLETMRIASAHRYRLLVTDAEDKDGVIRGMSLGVDHQASVRLRDVVVGMETLEKAAIKNLEAVMKDSPWNAWLKRARGVGAKQLARLLAAIGDPYWHAINDRPRTVGQLWAYSGYHAVPVGLDGKVLVKKRPATNDVEVLDVDPMDSYEDEFSYNAAPRRQRGVQANWSENARKRAWLIANSCIKQPPEAKYRRVYDDTRTKYLDAVHVVNCVRCGPAGNPALPGSQLSPGHQHGRALRKVAKEVLKDLWIEARRQHGAEPEGGDIEDYNERQAYLEAQKAAQELQPA